MPHHNPTDYGWKEDNGRLIPVWTTLSKAKEVFPIDILCSYEQLCSSLRCKCRRENLKCSPLCKCQSRKKLTFTNQFETNSSILEHDAKIENHRGCDSPRPRRVWGKVVGEHMATRACLFYQFPYCWLRLYNGQLYQRLCLQRADGLLWKRLRGFLSPSWQNNLIYYMTIKNSSNS